MRTLLIEKRKAKDLTVADMAKLLDKSSSFYYKIEAGIRNPNITTAKQIADIVGGTVDELFFDNILDSSSNNDETSATSETSATKETA
jgi:putative transcriptional regulator